MELSLFKLGVVLIIIGMIWIGIIFNGTEKTQEIFQIKQSNSVETKVKLTDTDIGFYKIYLPEFLGEQVFIQILDTHGNIIQEEKIQTKMSVGYFDFTDDGTYTMKVTNISKNLIDVQTEFGNTNSQEMVPAGILAMIGCITVLIMSYFKLANYNIAHPDEKIS